jgi:hypothetical protein
MVLEHHILVRGKVRASELTSEPVKNQAPLALTDFDPLVDKIEQGHLPRVDPVFRQQLATRQECFHIPQHLTPVGKIPRCFVKPRLFRPLVLEDKAIHVSDAFDFSFVVFHYKLVPIDVVQDVLSSTQLKSFVRHHGLLALLRDYWLKTQGFP